MVFPELRAHHEEKYIVLVEGQPSAAARWWVRRGDLPSRASEGVMAHLNVEGLPEPIVRGLEIIVEMARAWAGKKVSLPGHKRVRLEVPKGTVHGKLTREEIYDDLV